MTEHKDENNVEFDHFMENEVLPAYEEYLRDPSSALTSEQLREAIEATSCELDAKEQ